MISAPQRQYLSEARASSSSSSSSSSSRWQWKWSDWCIWMIIIITITIISIFTGLAIDIIIESTLFTHIKTMIICLNTWKLSDHHHHHLPLFLHGRFQAPTILRLISVPIDGFSTHLRNLSDAGSWLYRQLAVSEVCEIPSMVFR